MSGYPGSVTIALADAEHGHLAPRRKERSAIHPRHHMKVPIDRTLMKRRIL
ncbi:hypothetical protein ACFQ3B_15360 [Stackebrandtia endophytica]|uniref:hypothetical protein n=1 Tax=Stackebrandtia endophytica TaxID=1496996 RepID=UPI001476CF10|nr:hypothetical protein [Stackebrandtia endophytica]